MEQQRLLTEERAKLSDLTAALQAGMAGGSPDVGMTRASLQLLLSHVNARSEQPLRNESVEHRVGVTESAAQAS